MMNGIEHPYTDIPSAHELHDDHEEVSAKQEEYTSLDNDTRNKLTALSGEFEQPTNDLDDLDDKDGKYGMELLYPDEHPPVRVA